MLYNRISHRIPTVEIVTKGYIKGYDLRFHKRSKDGSAKADLFKTDQETDLVWGVIIKIKSEDKSILDLCENGYDCLPVPIISETNFDQAIFAYITKAEKIDDTILPYHWYKQFVLMGAIEHNFPLEYIQKIENVPFTIDPDENRKINNKNILSQ